MKQLDILLDTNVIRRLMEDNSSMIKVLEDMRNDDYDFVISDMSLFELLTSKEVNKDLNKFLSILYDYKIVPIFKKTLTDFNKQYINWFKEPKTNTEMKNNIYPSFLFTLSTFLSDFTIGVILSLANKLTSDYSSEFYLYILSIVNKTEIKTHFKKVIEDCYIHKKEKLRKRIPIELKDLIIRELTYFNLLEKQKKSIFTEQEFLNEFKNQNNKYINKSFKEICSSFLSEKDIMVTGNKIDDLDKRFIINYFKNVLCKNGKFSVNDITDYLNFKYGLKYCYSYYTTDKKSLKKYASYFHNPKIIKYIDKIKETLNKYPFTN